MALTEVVKVVNFFIKKIKLILFSLAMLFSAIVGAFLALKIVSAPAISDTLMQRKIQERVSEKISRIRATQGDILELAILESTATFELTDEWMKIPHGLGKSFSSVDVPAVFRFFVKISDPISVNVEEHDKNVICTVLAPKLHPVLPVAFDSSRMFWTRDIGVFRFNREEMTDSLHQKISMRLVLSAKNHARTSNVRDAARQAFEKFVMEWLQEIRELREHPSANISVKIIFADEVIPKQSEVGENPSLVPVSI